MATCKGVCLSVPGRVVVQSPSRVQPLAIPWTAACQVFLSFTISRGLSKFISYPLNWWCHPTISSSVTLFSFCLQSFPASGSSPMSQLFASGGQSIGVLTSVLPINIQGWFPLRLTGLTRKRKMTKSLETLINREGNDLNLYNSHTLVYCTLLINSHNWLSSPSAPSFVFS